MHIDNVGPLVNLNTSMWSPGVYFIQFRLDNKVVKYDKVVKL